MLASDELNDFFFYHQPFTETQISDLLGDLHLFLEICPGHSQTSQTLSHTCRFCCMVVIMSVIILGFIKAWEGPVELPDEAGDPNCHCQLVHRFPDYG